MSHTKDLQIVAMIIILTVLFVLLPPLIGLGLNFTPFGIRLVPILVSLSVFTLAMLLIAYIRRSKISEEERFQVPFSYIYSSLKSEIFTSKKGVDKILTIILILSIVASIII
jgi:uncharacterized membrane protein